MAVRRRGLMDKKYLALFDLDGTLFETGEVNYHAYQDALAPYGITLDKEYFLKRCNGRHYTEFLPAIMGAAADIEKVHQFKKTAYAVNLEKARMNKHLFALVQCMRDKYHTAIVTTASRQNTMEILQHFGCDPLFEYFVTQEDVTKTKPNPQGFLLAMQHFCMLPSNTVIFEDSAVGIQAARASGASVIVVDRF